MPLFVLKVELVEKAAEKAPFLFQRTPPIGICPMKRTHVNHSDLIINWHEWIPFRNPLPSCGKSLFSEKIPKNGEIPITPHIFGPTFFLRYIDNKLDE